MSHVFCLLRAMAVSGYLKIWKEGSLCCQVLHRQFPFLDDAQQLMA